MENKRKSSQGKSLNKSHNKSASKDKKSATPSKDSKKKIPIETGASLAAQVIKKSTKQLVKKKI